MFNNVIEGFRPFKHLSLGALSLGIGSEAPLERDAVLKGLTRIQEAFPELRESDYDSKKDIFKIDNGKQEADEQMLLVASKGIGLMLSWGPKVAFGTKDDISKLFKGYQEGASLLAVNVAYIDFRLFAISTWEGNHYALLWDTLFKTSPLFRMFEPKSVFQNDLILKAYLSEDRICVVEIESDVTAKEVRHNSYENDMLRTQIAIAKTRHFAHDVSLGELACEHVDFARSFVLERFIPSVAVPLDGALAEMQTEKDKT
ncbi:MAG: hypothetical protein GWP14_04275 [Actinobacteria bacterium]|nr:hypothetical protein [Actinomycetota bacterium]